MLIDRKPKFRSRKLEYNRSLAVYRYDEVNDFDDYDEPIRSVAQVATGVDKEEEEVLIDLLRSFVTFCVRNTI